ncbi:hypothetical protein NL676_018911 [Syzygium grande]|nr:hypothetical protein NL676_018911 [Syzygium grande]
MLAEEEDVNSLDGSENILIAPQCDGGENVNSLDGSETSWGNVNSLNGSGDIMVASQYNSEENGVCIMNQAETNSIVDVHHRSLSTEPWIGLEFQTKEAAYSFYREYACSVGFGITIKASRRSKKSGKFIDVKIACSRFGSKRESSSTVHPRPCIKTNCKAGMNMKRREDGIWIIYSVVKEHNHDIVPDDFYNSLCGRTKQANALAYQKKGLQAVLNEEDTQVMLGYLMSMQQESPNFFYAIDLGRDKCLRSVFWVDAKGRHDYASFCDVVFFDVFYVKENYSIPFLPIVGVNHHAQYLLLGCALIGDEGKSSYSWVMRAWLNAVGHQAPKVIITDQDKQLKEAVADVFPDICHCFCLWHIFRNVPLTLAHVLDKYDKFMDKFNKCVYLSWTDEQFEKRWQKLIHKFEIGEDEWVRSLYKDRKKWVPIYMQDAFLAGMSTADRAGSMTAFLDRMQRFNDLCKRAIKLGEEGSLSQEAYDIAFQALEEVSRRYLRLNSRWSVSEPSLVTVHQNAEALEENHGNVVKSLKRKKISKKRKVVHFEQGGATIRTQDNLHDMEQASLRTEDQDNCWISQQGMQNTESNFRTASLDGHDEAHQIMQGVGRQHSVSSRVFHCGTQQSLQELGQVGFRAEEIPGCFTVRSDFQYTGQPVGSMHLQFQGIALKSLQDKKLHRLAEHSDKLPQIMYTQFS